jgi:tight adherence protein C
MNLLILLLIFAATTLVWVSIAYLFMRRVTLQNRLQQVLNESIAESIRQVGERAHEAAKSSFIIKLLQQPFQRSGQLVLPRDQWELSYLKSRMVMAGFRQDEAPVIYQGARVVLALVLPSVYLLSRFIVGVVPIKVTVVSLVLTVIGFYLPTFYLRFRTARRQKRILKALPNALDMLIVCVEAGLGLDAAIKKVGEEMRAACPELSEEFQLMSLELRAGKSRMEAFKNIGARTGVDEIKAWVALMVQTDRFGTSVAGALRANADGMRVKRRQKLEEEAAKTSVKLIFPLIFFIFPAIMVVMVGPAIIQIARVLLPALGRGGH